MMVTKKQDIPLGTCDHMVVVGVDMAAWGLGALTRDWSSWQCGWYAWDGLGGFQVTQSNQSKCRSMDGLVSDRVEIAGTITTEQKPTGLNEHLEEQYKPYFEEHKQSKHQQTRNSTNWVAFAKTIHTTASGYLRTNPINGIGYKTSVFYKPGIQDWQGVRHLRTLVVGKSQVKDKLPTPCYGSHCQLFDAGILIVMEEIFQTVPHSMCGRININNHLHKFGRDGRIDPHDDKRVVGVMVVAAHLQLGNISLQGYRDRLIVLKKRRNLGFHLNVDSEFFMCDAKSLEDALIKRVVTPEEVITRTLDPKAALGSRGALAKTVYSRLFDFYYLADSLLKNRDYVVPDLLTASKHSFVVGLFCPLLVDSSKSYKCSSIGSRVKVQLQSLMETLSITELHYIRWCLEAIRFSCASYPTKRTFDEFLLRFGILYPDVVDGKYGPNPSVFGMKGYQIGKTKVFLQAG
ncbi:unconventional myosin [Tanacetum coccineum]